MPTEPPPLPQVSRKRILPAFALCFVLSAHRIYAGRYISGIVQVFLVAGSFLWMKIACKGLIAIVESATLDADMIDRVTDWEQVRGAPILPMLAVVAAGIWIAADAAVLVAGNFRDGKGYKINKWL